MSQTKETFKNEAVSHLTHLQSSSSGKFLSVSRALTFFFQFSKAAFVVGHMAHL